MGLVIIGHRSSKGTFGAYNFVFKGTRQCWWARATAHWVSRLFSTSVVVGSSHYSGGHGQTSPWCFHDSLHADNSNKHHWPFNKLLQRDLLWSNNNSQSDGKCNLVEQIILIHNHLVVLISGDVGADDHVCGGQQRAAKDELHEDGGLLAGLQPFHSFRRGSSSCVYGEKNVSPFCRFFIKEKVNGEDYDIKINRITVGSTAENKVTSEES